MLEVSSSTDVYILGRAHFLSSVIYIYILFFLKLSYNFFFLFFIIECGFYSNSIQVFFLSPSLVVIFIYWQNKFQFLSSFFYHRFFKYFLFFSNFFIYITFQVI